MTSLLNISATPVVHLWHRTRAQCIQQGNLIVSPQTTFLPISSSFFLSEWLCFLPENLMSKMPKVSVLSLRYEVFFYWIYGVLHWVSIQWCSVPSFSFSSNLEIFLSRWTLTLSQCYRDLWASASACLGRWHLSFKEPSGSICFWRIGKWGFSWLLLSPAYPNHTKVL